MRDWHSYLTHISSMITSNQWNPPTHHLGCTRAGFNSLVDFGLVSFCNAVDKSDKLGVMEYVLLQDRWHSGTVCGYSLDEWPTVDNV